MTFSREIVLSRPRIVIHLCFSLVFLFSTTLTLREMLLLKETYEISQRAQLNSMANALEREWQRSEDELYFFRSMLQHAISSPVENDSIRGQLTAFNRLRHQPVWYLRNSTPRSIPINGLSDAALTAWPLLNRGEGERLRNELTAALEMSFILQLSDPNKNFHSRLWYISRAGFYLSSTPPRSDSETLTSFRTMMARSYFTEMAPERNPERKLFWSGIYLSRQDEGNFITNSIPVDVAGHWYGVLAVEFSAARIAMHLRDALPEVEKGNVMLYDRELKLVAQTDTAESPDEPLNAETLSQLRHKMAHQQQGVMRSGTHFITWIKYAPSRGVLVKSETLREGVKGEIGRVALVLTGMWLLFSLVLFFTHQAIIRLVSKMLELHNRLLWRANYDSLTRLLNRGALFDIAERQANECQQASKPFAVIQLDLDRFKQVNDNWGHQAGDRVLSYAAAVLEETVRSRDCLGRVGGEEFCIGLPDTRKAEAVDVAERIRARLAKKQVMLSGGQILNVTASLGVASSEEVGDYQFESLQSLADRRLYLAKRAGRNRVQAEN